MSHPTHPPLQLLVMQFLSLKEISVTSFLGMFLCLFSAYLYPLPPHSLLSAWMGTHHTHCSALTFVSVQCVLGLLPVSTYGSALFFLMGAQSWPQCFKAMYFCDSSSLCLALEFVRTQAWLWQAGYQLSATFLFHPIFLCTCGSKRQWVYWGQGLQSP